MRTVITKNNKLDNNRTTSIDTDRASTKKHNTEATYTTYLPPVKSDNIHYTYTVARMYFRLRNKKRFTLPTELKVEDSKLIEFITAIPSYLNELQTIEFTSKTGETFHISKAQERHKWLFEAYESFLLQLTERYKKVLSETRERPARTRQARLRNEDNF